MHNKNKGHVAIQFTTETNQEVAKWSLAIEDKDLITTIINGKTKGGLVVNKLHLTLLYGLNDDIINTNEISKFIKKIKLEKIEVDGIDFFIVKKHNYNILYLKIKDNKGELRRMNEELKRFPLFQKYKDYGYIPHVTIAYVKKDFNLDVLKQKLPKILHISSIQYIIHETTK